TSSDNTVPETFDKSTIATLELTPGQAESLINASMRGQLSLTLRSVVDFGRAADMERPAGSSQTVRVIRAGKEQNVLAGGVAHRETQQDIYSMGDEYGSSDEYLSQSQFQVDAVQPQMMPQ